MYPIVCFSCGFPIGHIWLQYFDLIKIMSEYDALRQLGIGDECCRRMFICQVPDIHNLIY